VDLATTGTTAVTSVVHLFNGSPDTLSLTAASLVVEPAASGFAVELASEDPLGPNESRVVTITWTPTVTGTATAVLKARLGGRTAEVQLKGSSS
jgi:type 1 fimbria pilin